MEFPWETRPFVPSTDRRVSHDQWISVLGYLFSSRYLSGEQLIMWRRHQEAKTLSEWRGMSGWLKYTWRASESNFDRQAVFWQDLARWSQETGAAVAPARRDAVRAAADVCQDVSRWYAERSSLFSPGKDRLARAGGVLRLIRAGAYRRGFGAAAFAKDIARVMV